MARRLSASAALLLFLFLAQAPAASSSVFSVVQESDGMTMIAVRFPLAGPPGADDLSFQYPLGSDVLYVDLQPVALPGPGGSVDVDAFLAEAWLVTGAGIISLPSLIILPEEGTLEGELAEAVEELQADLVALRLEVEALAADAEEAAAGAQAEAAIAAQEVHDEAMALAAEVAWLQAMAAEIVGETSSGAEAQMALANAMIARIQAGLALLDPVVAHLEEELASVVPPTPTPPTTPATPSPDPLEPVRGRLEKVQERIDRAVERAEAARDTLVAEAGEALAKVDELVDEQAALDAARTAVEAALQALQAEVDKDKAVAEEKAEGAKAKVEELKLAVDALRAAAEATRAEKEQEVQAAAEEAQESLDEAIAPMRWALDWAESARAWAQSAGDDSVADAMGTVEQAAATAEAVRAIVERYAGENVGPGSDAALAQAAAALDGASGQLAQAQASLEAALAQLQGLPGGLDPPDPEAPDADSVALCVEGPLASICTEYASPGPDQKEIVVLVAVPRAEIPGLPPLSQTVPGIPVGPGGPPSVSTAQEPTVPTLPGLPSTSPTVSQPPSSPTAPSTSAPATSPSPTPQSTQARASPPQLHLAAEPADLQMVEGRQETLLVRIRNSGGSPDTVRLTIEMDAPVTADSTQGSIAVDPGREETFSVRVTPLSSGSGSLTLVASGDEGGTLRREIAVFVARPPSSASNITARLDPAALRVTLGEEAFLTVHIANGGTSPETVTFLASAGAAELSPASGSVYVAPGESAVRQVTVTPTREGDSSVRVRLSTSTGVLLEPVAFLGVGPSAAVQEEGPGSPTPSEPGSTPGFGWALLTVALIGGAVASRRLRR